MKYMIISGHGAKMRGNMEYPSGSLLLICGICRTAGENIVMFFSGGICSLHGYGKNVSILKNVWKGIFFCPYIRNLKRSRILSIWGYAEVPFICPGLLSADNRSGSFRAVPGLRDAGFLGVR